MIDYVALNSSVEALTQVLRGASEEQRARRQAARALWTRAVAEPGAWRAKLAAYRRQAAPPWRLAVPLEPFGVVEAGPAPVPPYAVVATDGSQLTPSHHEIALCFLLNVGRVRLHYGPGGCAVLTARPRLYHREEELFPSAGGQSLRLDEAYLGALRGLLEWQHLAEIAEEAAATGQPVVAFVDGPLAAHGSEALPNAFRAEIRAGREAALARLRALGVPVAGYVSQSRSQAVVDFLRLLACPFSEPACAGCAERPCGRDHLPLSDRMLWEGLLKPGQRSSLFRLEGGFAFFYLHVGTEAARVEVPDWVAADSARLGRVQACAYDQACKGGGYPVALQEAHHLAVVTGEERRRFFAWLGRRLQAAGLRPSLSPKERRKRGGFT